jgi:hypothetical protein
MKRWLPPPFLLGALPRNGADINLPREMRDLCCFCTIPPVAPWVVGIEGTWTDSAITGNTLIGTSTAPATQVRFTSSAQWFAALTGRVGYAANDWLFYAKGGGGWMRVSYTELAI